MKNPERVKELVFRGVGQLSLTYSKYSIWNTFSDLHYLMLYLCLLGHHASNKKGCLEVPPRFLSMEQHYQGKGGHSTRQNVSAFIPVHSTVHSIEGFCPTLNNKASFSALCLQGRVLQDEGTMEVCQRRAGDEELPSQRIQKPDRSVQLSVQKTADLFICLSQ